MSLEINVVSKDHYFEFTCKNIILGKLINIHDKSVLVIDVVVPWNFNIDKTVEIEKRKLIYHYEYPENTLIEKIEYVGYDSGQRVEMISIRIYFKKLVDVEVAKNYLLQYLRQYNQKLLELLSREEKRSEL